MLLQNFVCKTPNFNWKPWAVTFQKWFRRTDRRNRYKLGLASAQEIRSFQCKDYKVVFFVRVCAKCRKKTKLTACSHMHTQKKSLTCSNKSSCWKQVTSLPINIVLNSKQKRVRPNRNRTLTKRYSNWKLVQHSKQVAYDNKCVHSISGSHI